MKSKTLIINPPFIEPHRPPIGCAILAEVCRLEGHDVTVLDLNLELFHNLKSKKFYEIQENLIADYATQEEIEQLTNWVDHQLSDLDGYEWIMISGFSYWNNKMIRMICENIKPKVRSKIVVGGASIEAGDYGRMLYDESLVDYYIYGEGEIALRELIIGNYDYPGINGRPPMQIENVEDLPLPNYSYFDLDKYDLLMDKPDLFIYGSRGCVRKCTFCDVEHYWPKFRFRTGKNIAEEMISNYEKFGVTNYFFVDSLLNGNLKEFRRFAEILAKYKPGLFNWGGYGIVRPRRDHPAELFDIIRDGGGTFFNTAIETGVDRIRKEMKKNFSNEDIDWHFEQSQRIRMRNLIMLIPTWPSETLAEHHEYLEIFKRWKRYALDRTIYAVALSPGLAILKGSPLYSMEGSAFHFNHNNNTLANNVTNLNEDPIPYSWLGREGTGLTHREKFRRAIEIYREATKNYWPIAKHKQRLTEFDKIIDLIHDYTKQSTRNIIPIKPV